MSTPLLLVSGSPDDYVVSAFGLGGQRPGGRYIGFNAASLYDWIEQLLRTTPDLTVAYETPEQPMSAWDALTQLADFIHGR